jgi:DNA topoisomerase I
MTAPHSQEIRRQAAKSAAGNLPRRPVQPPRVITDPVQSAQVAGLAYISDDMPGIRRVRRGKGFSYVGLDGRPIHDPDELARIRALAIPPAWTEVWICPLPNGHLQATGRDAKGRKQYRYHTSWGEQRSSTKYSRMALFGLALPVIRARVDHDLSLRELSRLKVLATVLRVMELTFIRVGNREYARANKSFGLTTLRDRHVQISDSKIRFSFRGKSGQDHDIEVTDRRLARIVKQCRDVPGYELFQYYDEHGEHQAVGSADVNDYLREITGQDFTAKDFRTWGGTVLAARELSKLWPTEPKKRQKNITQAVRKVANELGNRPATCRKYYIHPAIVEAYLDGSLTPRLEQYAAVPAADLPEGLNADEAAVLALLEEKLAQVAGTEDE